VWEKKLYLEQMLKRGIQPNGRQKICSLIESVARATASNRRQKYHYEERTCSSSRWEKPEANNTVNTRDLRNRKPRHRRGERNRDRARRTGKTDLAPPKPETRQQKQISHHQTKRGKIHSTHKLQNRFVSVNLTNICTIM
jgi:hypothetical protein